MLEKLKEAYRLMELANSIGKKFHDDGPEGLKIFQVDGPTIRNNILADFIAGGHHLVYDFIPENEIWIEYEHSVDEQRKILAHELVERMLMKHHGMRYIEAHNKANKVETQLRSSDDNPDKILDIFNKFCHENFKKPELQNMGRQLTLAYLSY
jgi:hypothetical protein